MQLVLMESVSESLGSPLILGDNVFYYIQDIKMRRGVLFDHIQVVLQLFLHVLGDDHQ